MRSLPGHRSESKTKKGRERRAERCPENIDGVCSLEEREGGTPPTTLVKSLCSLVSRAPAIYLSISLSLHPPLTGCSKRRESERERRSDNKKHSRKRPGVKGAAKVAERHRNRAELPGLGREAHAQPGLLDDEAGIGDIDEMRQREQGETAEQQDRRRQGARAATTGLHGFERGRGTRSSREGKK